MAEHNTAAPATRAETATMNTKRQSPLRRAGCVFGIVLWAVLMLMPFLLIALAVRGEITIDTGAAPDQRLRIWLIMEAKERGVGISTAFAQQLTGQTCVQTDVRFFMWEGPPGEPHSYCECYNQTVTGDWLATVNYDGGCTPD